MTRKINRFKLEYRRKILQYENEIFWLGRVNTIRKKNSVKNGILLSLQNFREIN